MAEYIDALLNGVVKHIAAKEATRAGDANVWHQIVIPHQLSRQDTFTGTTAGTTVSTPEIPCNRFAIQVKGTGAAPTSWQVVIEGSLNGTDFTPLATHESGVNADGSVLWQAQATAAKYFRSRVLALVLGSATNIVVDIIGEAGL